jgi:hypothetical protein
MISIENCPSLRIAVINCVEFHFEIVAGVLYVLRPYESKVHVYLSTSVKRKNYDGETIAYSARRHDFYFHKMAP